MHLTARHRLNHSLEFVSQRLTYFQRFEALAEAKDILQNRRGDLQKPVTCNWALEFWFCGKCNILSSACRALIRRKIGALSCKRPHYSLSVIWRFRRAMTRIAFCAFPVRFACSTWACLCACKRSSWQRIKPKSAFKPGVSIISIWP